MRTLFVCGAKWSPHRWVSGGAGVGSGDRYGVAGENIAPQGSMPKFTHQTPRRIGRRSADRASLSRLGRRSSAAVVPLRRRSGAARVPPARTEDARVRRRVIEDEPARIPYAEIAEHRAAVFFPSVGHTKLTLHELRAMGMPLLLPSKALMYRVEELVMDAWRLPLLAHQFGGRSKESRRDVVDDDNTGPMSDQPGLAHAPQRWRPPGWRAALAGVLRGPPRRSLPRGTL